MVEFGREPHDSENDGFDLELEASLEQELRASLQARACARWLCRSRAGAGGYCTAP